jgi:hypothetical protein
MGEVFRARDTRLGRSVAIKILPAEMTADSAKRARFQQEARAASALNHPNIVCLYDIGTDNGIPFIVSELIDGESLRHVIEQGPLPPNRIADIAIQVAQGLDAAHRAGVIHRDIKPENIMLTRDGHVKILDFGLAKQLPQASAAQLSTETQFATSPGVVMGTPGYMSPEQVRGKLADARSDIFSVGAVLYELATGRRAFPGGNIIETLSAILRDSPPPLPAGTTPALSEIVGRCLEKDPERRCQSAANLLFALRVAAGTRGGQQLVPRRATPRLIWIGAAALMAGMGMAVHYWPKAQPAAPPAVVPAASQGQAAQPAMEPKPAEPGNPAPKEMAAAHIPKKVDKAEVPQEKAEPPSPLPKPESTPASSPGAMRRVAAEVAKALVEARYADAMKDFDEDLTKRSPTLPRDWEQMEKPLGGFQWSSTPFPHANSELVLLEFERGVITLRLLFAQNAVHGFGYLWRSRHPDDPAPAPPISPPNPERAREIYDQVGRASWQEHNDTKALDLFSKVLQYDAGFAPAYRDRCATFNNSGDYRRGALDCVHAVRLAPDYALAYSSLGTSLDGLGAFDHALAILDQAILLKPDESHFYQQRAWTYRNLQQFEACVEDGIAAIASRRAITSY